MIKLYHLHNAISILNFSEKLILKADDRKRKNNYQVFNVFSYRSDDKH